MPDPLVSDSWGTVPMGLDEDLAPGGLYPPAEQRRLVVADRWSSGRNFRLRGGQLRALASVPLAFGYEAAKALAMQKRSPFISDLGKEAMRRGGQYLGSSPISPENLYNPLDNGELWQVDARTRSPTWEAPIAYTRGVLGQAQAVER